MSDDIPDIDPDLTMGESQADREKLELRLLEAEALFREHGNREAGQRFWLRWIAAMVGVGVIFLMVALLTHLIHQVFWGPILLVGPAFSVAMIIAPITSITAITVVFFIGAFRKFEDKDLEKMGNGVSGAANWMRGG